LATVLAKKWLFPGEKIEFSLAARYTQRLNVLIPFVWEEKEKEDLGREEREPFARKGEKVKMGDNTFFTLLPKNLVSDRGGGGGAKVVLRGTGPEKTLPKVKYIDFGRTGGECDWLEGVGGGGVWGGSRGEPGLHNHSFGKQPYSISQNKSIRVMLNRTRQICGPQGGYK